MTYGLKFRLHSPLCALRLNQISHKAERTAGGKQFSDTPWSSAQLRGVIVSVASSLFPALFLQS